MRAVGASERSVPEERRAPTEEGKGRHPDEVHLSRSDDGCTGEGRAGGRAEALSAGGGDS